MGRSWRQKFSGEEAELIMWIDDDLLGSMVYLHHRDQRYIVQAWTRGMGKDLKVLLC